MLLFEETVNLREEICKGIQAEDWFRTSGEQLLYDTVWLVGRENDCIFLFRYNTGLPNNETTSSLKKKTHIGMCRLLENKVKTLFSFDKEKDVVHCTVNDRHSLLVFCVATDGPIKARSSTTQDMRLYIAEVQQGVRRTSVPIEIVAERLENTKSAQFIHQTGADRKVKLVIFEHCEYIGVLHLAVDSYTGKLKDRVKRYKPDWVIGRHFWYQWDVDRQQLFTIATDINNDITLDVFQTSDKTTLQKLFSMPVTIDSKCKKRPRLSRLNLEQRCQDRNIIALTNPESTNDGLLCLCSQVPYERRDKSEVENPFTLKYEILSFVHGKRFTVAVPNIPGRMRKTCIHFTLIGNNVVAYLPGAFTHFLNVHDIAQLGVLNIISPGESHSRVADCPGILSRVQLPYLRKKHAGVFMYDSSSMWIYEMSLSESALLDKFAEKWPSEPRALSFSPSPMELTNQLAILQHTLQTTADVRRPRQLLESMKNDVTSADTITALTEYMLGSSFAVVSRAIKKPEAGKVFCRLLPFTCMEADRSHTVKVNVGDKQTAIKIDITEYSVNVTVEAGVGKDCGFFVFLYLVKTKRQGKRFNVKEVRRVLDRSRSATNVSKTSKLMQLLSFKRKDNPMTTSQLLSSESRAAAGCNMTDSFPDCLLNDDVDENVVSGITEVLMKHLKRCYSTADFKSSTVKGAKPNPLFVEDPKKLLRDFEPMCSDYGRILVNEVKILLHHLYNIFGLKQLHNKQYAVQINDDMLKAFLMFERYQYAVQALGLPLPSEFPTLLTTLAYQSLRTEEFMQYVSNGIVEVTPDFLNVLATDRTPDKAPIKAEILARMPHDEAVRWSYKLMESPLVGATATRVVAESIFTKYSAAGRSSRDEHSMYNRNYSRTSEDGDADQDDFDPDLPESYSFMIKKLSASGWTPGTNGISSAMLERAVFYYTTEDDHPH